VEKLANKVFETDELNVVQICGWFDLNNKDQSMPQKFYHGSITFVYRIGKIFSEAFRFKNLFNIIISKLNKKYTSMLLKLFISTLFEIRM